MIEEKAYQYWLHNLPGIGDRTIEKLLCRFGSAKGIYRADPGAFRQAVGERRAAAAAKFTAAWDVEKNYQDLLRRGISFLTKEDEQYPKRLKKVEHPPYALYYLGALLSEQSPSAAVVGARECSEYGSSMARAFAGTMAGAGVAIVSGMARGIDGIGQEAALAAGGSTYAVLGSGVDVCYPESNRALYRRILASGGGIISPFPPGTQPLRQNFPARNRIVAGLSDVLLVVEARLKSGTWITVDMALDQGKSVYAIPGRLTDRLSDGCNLLIRQGAGIALSPEDILAELRVLQNRRGMEGRKNSSAALGEVTETEQNQKRMEVLSALDAYPKSADEILEDMRKKGEKMELPGLLEELIRLCIEKKACQRGGYFVKIG